MTPIASIASTQEPQTPIERAGQAADTVVSGVEGFWGDLLLRGDVWANLALSLVTILAVVLLRRVFLNVMDRHVEDVRARYRWAKTTAYTGFLVVAVMLLLIWTGGNLASLGTFLGLLTAGLAIALRDLVANLAGWVFILWRRPFDVGDRVQIAGFAGDVIDIRVLQFTVLEIGNWVDADQSTGRIVHIPNQKVFSDPQANYTAQFEYIWHEIPVLVTFESDWRKAKEILTEVADEHARGAIEEAQKSLRRAARKFLIFYPTLTPIVYTTVKDSGVMLTIRYLCKPRQRRGTGEVIWEAILDRFGAEPGIDFAYPTRRLYYNQLEGKDGARAPLPDGLGGAPSGASGEPPPSLERPTDRG